MQQYSTKVIQVAKNAALFLQTRTYSKKKWQANAMVDFWDWAKGPPASFA